MTRVYRRWTDQELYDLYCWYIAKRRLGNNVRKALDLNMSVISLTARINKARMEILEIEQRLGKTPEDRERAIRAVIA